MNLNDIKIGMKVKIVYGETRGETEYRVTGLKDREGLPGVVYLNNLTSGAHVWEYASNVALVPETTVRKFYKTTFQVTVLSEEHYFTGGKSAKEILSGLVDNFASGEYAIDLYRSNTELLMREQMVQECHNIGASPAMYNLDRHGNDIYMED